MGLAATFRSTLERSVRLADELADALPEEALSRKLPDLPSNTIGQQLWCVVGARESYARALREGAWAGFSCSLTGEECAPAVAAALRRSGADLVAAVSPESFTDAQWQLALDVLEHEAAHHGQLIRYLYALRLPVPAGWKARYALD